MEGSAGCKPAGSRVIGLLGKGLGIGSLVVSFRYR